MSRNPIGIHEMVDGDVPLASGMFPCAPAHPGKRAVFLSDTGQQKAAADERADGGNNQEKCTLK
jgi:hypothetical protein